MRPRHGMTTEVKYMYKGQNEKFFTYFLFFLPRALVGTNRFLPFFFTSAFSSSLA